MPNRIIKESIRTSKSVNQMTDFQFRMWAYLLTYVDDYGRGSADPELLKGFVFPRRKGVSERTIEQTLTELATIGSILLYEVDGESYLCFPRWSEHQRIQQKKSKFPSPPDEIYPARKSTVDHGDPPPASNPNPNPNTKGNNARGTRFTPPDIDSVSAFIAENGYTTVDPQRFVDYYTANGWRVGKNPMKDWKAAVRGWASRDSSRQNEAVKNNPALNYAQRTYTEEEAASFYSSYDDLEALYGNKV